MESGSVAGLMTPELVTLKAVNETCGPLSLTIVAVGEA